MKKTLQRVLPWQVAKQVSHCYSCNMAFIVSDSLKTPKAAEV